MADQPSQHGGEELEADLAKRLGKAGLLGPVTTVVMCGDESEAKCASAKKMKKVWKVLKKRVKQLRQEQGVPVAAVRSRCLGVCKHGPLVGVLPEGRWYGHCQPETVEAILQHHVAGGPAPSDGEVLCPGGRAEIRPGGPEIRPGGRAEGE